MTDLGRCARRSFFLKVLALLIKTERLRETFTQRPRKHIMMPNSTSVSKTAKLENACNSFILDLEVRFLEFRGEKPDFSFFSGVLRIF